MEDWIHLNITSGQGNGEVNIEIDQNNNYSDRSTSIDVSTVYQVKTININQKGTNIMNVRFEFTDFTVPPGHIGSCGTFNGCYFDDTIGDENKNMNVTQIFERINRTLQNHRQVNIDILTNTLESYKVTYIQGSADSITCVIPLPKYYLVVEISKTKQTINFIANKLN